VRVGSQLSYRVRVIEITVFLAANRLYDLAVGVDDDETRSEWINGCVMMLIGEAEKYMVAAGEIEPEPDVNLAEELFGGIVSDDDS